MKRGYLIGRQRVLSALIIGFALMTGLLTLALPYALGQTPEAIWIRQFGTITSDLAEGAAADAAGNVYVVGFTNGTLPGQTVVGASFVRKYDASGNEKWTRQFSATRAHAVGVDGLGNVYVFGWTVGALPGQTSAGATDGYVRKYDPNGNELWTRQFGTSGSEFAIGGGVAVNGNAYFVGDTSGVFPGGQTPAGAADAFVCKFDQWKLHVPPVWHGRER